MNQEVRVSVPQLPKFPPTHVRIEQHGRVIYLDVNEAKEVRDELTKALRKLRRKKVKA